jgi:hypothetical protein
MQSTIGLLTLFTPDCAEGNLTIILQTLFGGTKLYWALHAVKQKTLSSTINRLRKFCYFIASRRKLNLKIKKLCAAEPILSRACNVQLSKSPGTTEMTKRQSPRRRAMTPQPRTLPASSASIIISSPDLAAAKREGPKK